MKERITSTQSASRVCYETMEAHARSRIRSWLQDLLEGEVTEFLGRAKSQRRKGLEQAASGYRNGYGKPRRVALTAGTITVRRPRMRNLSERFESRVLPLFKRRTAELGAMLPQLYLHGLSSGDFELALRGLLGEGAPLSASSLARLKGAWQAEYEDWKRADLSKLELVYWWADGLYVKAGLADRKAALLVIVGATASGEKVLLACQAGERESKESWLSVLRDLKAQGLKFPRLAVADGNLGIWAALGEIHPAGDEQRCWNHKIVNVLDALPKKAQPEAAQRLRAMMYAQSRPACERKRDEFLLRFKKTDPKACATLTRDWERLLRLPARALDSPAHHQHRRVAISCGAAENRRLTPLQENRERRGDDLEVAAGRTTIVARAQRTAADEGCLQRKTIQGRNGCAHEDRADKESRLNPFTHLLTTPRVVIHCVYENG
jgi:putative transposase